jgi:hypothetical protein
LRVTFLCVLLLAAQVHGGAQSTPASTPLTVAEFVSALDTLTAALSDASPADADALIARVPLRWRVNTGAHAIAVDGTWIIHALRDAAANPADWTDRRKQIASRIAEIRAHAADRGRGDGLDTTREHARSAVASVLERQEFRQRGESWLEALQQDIAEWFRRILARVGASELASRRTAIVLAWIAALAAFAGLAVWLARVLGKPRQGAGLGLARRMAPRVSAREWTSRALAAFRGGDMREATRCAYNAGIRRVEEEGGWRIDHARTPREYLPLLRPNDSRRLPVEELTKRFEQVWYGNRTTSEADTRSLFAHLEKLGCRAAE